jgi:hypothetical protein
VSSARLPSNVFAEVFSEEDMTEKWVDPEEYTDHELVALMASALNRIAYALELITKNAAPTPRPAQKRIVLRGRR